MTVPELIARIQGDVPVTKADIRLARTLGVATNTVAEWRKGYRVPRQIVRARLARMDGVAVGDVTWTKQRITSPL